MLESVEDLLQHCFYYFCRTLNQHLTTTSSLGYPTTNRITQPIESRIARNIYNYFYLLWICVIMNNNNNNNATFFTTEVFQELDIRRAHSTRMMPTNCIPWALGKVEWPVLPIRYCSSYLFYILIHTGWVDIGDAKMHRDFMVLPGNRIWHLYVSSQVPYQFVY